MASSSQDQKSENKIGKKRKKSGRAVFGCFVRNKQRNKGPILALVCRHVTQAAEEKFFLDENCTKEVANKVYNTNSLDRLKNDIDVVQLTTTSQHLVRPVFRNACGKKGEFSLYEGTVAGLSNTLLFQCHRPKLKREADIRQGRVLNIADVPDAILHVIDTECNFIVDDANGKPFADEGDSGRVVAREVNGSIELVGIITWGQYQSRVNSQNAGNFSICMLLKSAIQCLNERYQLSLCLLRLEVDQQAIDGDDDDVDCNDSEDGDTIEPGQIVVFTFKA